jgi:hypothetical protein
MIQMNDEQALVVHGTVGLGGFTWYSLTLNETVAALTIAYLLLQIGLLMPKYWRLFKECSFCQRARRRLGGRK